MSDQTAGPAPAPLAPAYRRYALGVLLAIYTLNFLDRQIVTILAEPIRNDLGLKDWQLGMMTGFAFALLYTVMGIPIARYAERANRPFIIATATAVWSLFTVFCGMATNFVQLILARVGVGIGEAGCTPPAHSLISDYVPKEKRASAMAFYHLGTPLGSLLGLVMGGLAADLWGWRTAFLIAGVPGIVMAVVAFTTLKEPRRDLPRVTASGPSLADALRELAAKRTFWCLAVAAALIAFNGYGSAAFIGSFFFRNHAGELTELAASIGLQPIGFLGLVLGLSGGIAGMFGTWFGGWIADWLGREDLRAHMVVPAVAGLAAIPIYVAGLLLDSAVAAIVVLTIPTILASLWYGPVYSSVQGLVRPQTRATASAILLFIINLIGLGLGPLGIGMLSDVLAGPYGMGAGEGIRWSLIIFSLLGLFAAALFWIARRTIREETVG
ncbi:MAG: MFS transporter [Alphaproteobacteria bacterium]|nr:MFS transporter [Alphaproteobacteria bacterium]